MPAKDLITARSPAADPVRLLRSQFGDLCRGTCDAVFGDSNFCSVFGICGLPHRVPVLSSLLRNKDFLQWLAKKEWPRASLLLVWDASSDTLTWHDATSEPTSENMPPTLNDAVRDLLRRAEFWGGTLDEEGAHSIDLRAPSPGPHFHINLLLGRRVGFSHPLQTTPKSVVDRVGRGSFRSHAATQVLATRWDLNQEENGFPANRQFYLTEDGTQIFYSASPEGPEIAKATCTHTQNGTRIAYLMTCGIEIERLIFILPQEPGLPSACEIQEIRVRNCSERRRDLRLVYTGMFGPTKPGALMEDVLYSAIILQAALIPNPDGSIMALTPDYHPAQAREDQRFQALAIHCGENRSFPRELGTNYQEFIGNGTIERPEMICALSNRLSRKGPGFFALGAPLPLDPGETVIAESFTGMSSSKVAPAASSPDLCRDVRALLDRFSSPEAVHRAWDDQRRFFDRYAEFFSINSGRPGLDVTCNRNLPFQVYYQTFASRSFCQTQKGYREIGFREIQDLFASMPYFHAGGMTGLVQDLIGEWAAHVYGFGYADHNFFWTGKEPGRWSDDALWLVQAVGRFVSLTGNVSVLDQSFPVSGTPGLSRTLYQTLQAIVRYSGEISVGTHGLPLLDGADWNDCLRLDRDFLDGPAKETLFRNREANDPAIARSSIAGHYTESVMNAFLVKLAADELARLAAMRGDASVSSWASSIALRMSENCRAHAWKKTYYCRLLLNRDKAHTYVGASGDGLASDGAEGSYFLNSFSWSVLSGVADEEQIRSMFEVLETRLRTEHGYRLVTAMDMGRVDPDSASDEYFPGDRENGAVFKHASMMAVMALLEAASSVGHRDLARRMASAAWWMIDLVLPNRTLSDPFVLGGNPRFCTQYTNSETGENIGPLLSGTASWLTLAILRAYGIDLRGDALFLDPLLRESDRETEVFLRLGVGRYRIVYSKPKGFLRTRDSLPELSLDGIRLATNCVPIRAAAEEHIVTLRW